ncbi:MAG: CarD family transcriptional regulator [Desulfarculaceae bacterium]|nr:CarD family transcriptional regulator [Desulfarculaceae bacterium]MCF8047588.1 CarD family transcriptional regulator [Desulfarculaceae bacterium]MCF8064819.1 CarD family transcriptional regulator [Desulfarculaceae bacterium]MCF8123409.1 CarD family transcriptional regulator [Desulfarculaceae bacterium]
MFKKGQLAVYPAHGVGVIESEEEKHIGGLAQRFYILRILENDMIIMIPTDNADTVGLRPVIDQKQVSQVYSILKDRDVIIENQTWNRRYRDYMKKIKTGSVFEVAEVLRDLFLLKLDKELSFGERKMLDTARGLLVKELSIARQAKEEEIEAEVEKIFHA